MTERTTKDLRHSQEEMTRRDMLRRAGMVGAGALGLGFAGCKQRPADDLVDLGSSPGLLQQGGTVSGQLTGLLDGDVVTEGVIKLAGFKPVQADARGNFEIRVKQSGDYDVELNGGGHHKRVGRLRVTGNVSLSPTLLEEDAGLPLEFINQYARGAGPVKEGVPPRTPGATNRWTAPPVVQIYRGLVGSDKEVVTDARVDAMRTSILALFGALTGNRLGLPQIEVRPGAAPTRLSQVPRGRLVIVQRADPKFSSEHIGSVSNGFDISKAIVACGVESTIEFFNRMFAHSLGGYVVSFSTASILNPAGRAAPSDRDSLAATFLYSRIPGNLAPDQDPSGVFLNA